MVSGNALTQLPQTLASPSPSTTRTREHEADSGVEYNYVCSTWRYIKKCYPYTPVILLIIPCLLGPANAMLEFSDKLEGPLPPPPPTPRDVRQSVIRPKGVDSLTATEEYAYAESVRGQSRLRCIFWPAIATCFPITILAATLLALVFANLEVPRADQFRAGMETHRDYFLVNFPSTRLVFIASFLSTAAPLISSYIMALYAIVASSQLRDASRTSDMSGLPTPFQMSLLVGVLLASMDQLREYFAHLFSRNRRASISPIVHRSAGLFALSVLLASAIILADTVLHYVTSTISFEQIISSTATPTFSRGLSETCLSFDRTALFGWPCSVGLGWDDPNLIEEQNEAIRLSHNASTHSEIRISPIPGNRQNMAYLLPHAGMVASTIDYRATTLGISTQCSILPPSSCGVSNTSVWGPSSIYTNYSCSPSFHGTLGITPSPSEADGSRAPDPYRSFLMYKPTANLMYSFFNTSDLQTVYNTPGYNDSGQLDPFTLPLPDDELVNPFYVGIAARLPLSSFPATSAMTKSNLAFPNPENAYVDFILSCSVTSYDVEYSYIRGAVQADNVTATKSTNGSVLEIFHGSLLYNSVGNQGYDLQDFLAQAALSLPLSAISNTTNHSSPTPSSTDPSDAADAFTSSFASLYATKVLAKIGAYTAPQDVLAVQERKTMLLAKVPKYALIALVTLSFNYPLIGSVFLWKACRATRSHHENAAGARADVRGDGGVQDIAGQLSLAGLASAAFGEKMNDRGGSPGFSRSGSEVGSLESEKGRRELFSETRRVVVSGDMQRGFGFKVWV